MPLLAKGTTQPIKKDQCARDAIPAFCSLFVNDCCSSGTEIFAIVAPFFKLYAIVILLYL